MTNSQRVIAIVGVVGFIMVTGAFFAVIFIPQTINLPEGDLGKQIIGMLGMVTGTWNSLVLLIYNWNFSSSKGSSDKTVLLEKKLNNQTP